MDLGATAALAAVAWTNGVQRVPAGAVVLRRALGGAWAPAALDSSSTRWQVVGWWAPLTQSLVLRERAADRPGDAAPRRAARRLAVRIRRARPWLRALRALGGAELASLVLGVPWLASRFGGLGLAAGVAAVLALAAATAATAAVALRTLGLSRRAAIAASLPLLSPFGAPRAADVVLERAAGDAPAELVARELLPAETFASLVRPWAYDALRGGAADRGDRRAAALVSTLGAHFLASIVAAPPPARDRRESYCPRCAALYDAGVDDCGDCAGVALVRPAGAATAQTA